MKRCEKSPAKDKNLPLEPIVATGQVSRPPVMRAAIPIGDFICTLSSDKRGQTSRDARRSTDGELVATNIVARGPRPATRVVAFAINNLSHGPPS
jgi:hypothetical protein